MIPNFPEYKKLSLADKEEIKNFIRKFPPYSDYNFTSLYCYNINDKVEISWLNGNLVVLFQDYTSDEMFYSFLGNNEIAETIETLLKQADIRSVRKGIHLIPECSIQPFSENGHSFSFNADQNNHDYILSVEALCNYNGSQFQSKRNSVSKFLKTYSDFETKVLNLENEIVKNKLVELFRIWSEGKKVKEENAKHELQALEKFVSNTQHFSALAIGVFIKDKLVAFTINELLENNFAIGHFGKYDVSIDGLFPYLLKETAKLLHEKKYFHINIEQDLGIDGLKRMKQSFRPIYYLNKYKITAK